MPTITSPWLTVSEIARKIVHSKDLAFAQSQANLILEIALKETNLIIQQIDETESTSTLKTPISQWEDAKKMIPRDEPAADAIMAEIRTIDNMSVFTKTNRYGVKGTGEWFANTRNKAVRIGYKIASAFHGENGGQVSWQSVAMFSLAVDEDRATKMKQSEIDLIAGGFEEDSPEAKKQDALKEKYPSISKAILSFF